MDIEFYLCRALILVPALWTNFQTIDFMQDTKREKLFDLNSRESKFTLVLWHFKSFPGWRRVPGPKQDHGARSGQNLCCWKRRQTEQAETASCIEGRQGSIANCWLRRTWKV